MRKSGLTGDEAYVLAKRGKTTEDLGPLKKEIGLIKEDLDYINQGFSNDCQRIARTRECVKKYGTAYLSFMRPQYEGPDKENGNGKVYFDNKEMLFKAVVDKPKKPKKGTVKAVSKETKTEEATNEKE